MADISERIEKQMEGTNLALAAVAEVLQKMDGRLAKEEADAAAQYELDAADAARADLVKSIANEVIAVIKDTEGKGMDVSGDERKAKATGGTPQNADDSESAANPTTKIEDQQNTIQAMQKNHHMEDDEDDAEKGGMAYKDAEEDEEAEEEAADMPAVNGKDMEEEDEDEMKAMSKQLEAMRKQLEAAEANMQKAVQTEAENRLRKMGFREENGLQAPKITNGLGLDDSTPLVKADSMNTVDQLASLSYTELRNLQHQIETGNTDGVPRELLG